MHGGVRLTIAGVDAPAAGTPGGPGRLLRVTATLRRPLPYRNFGTPDQELRLAWRGIRVFGAVKSAALVEVLARGSPLAEATAAARAWARRTVAAAIGPDDPQAAAIVLAVLIGDRAGLSPDIEARLQRAGTYHVLAISGGNIAVLAAIVLAHRRPSRPGAAAARGRRARRARALRRGGRRRRVGRAGDAGRGRLPLGARARPAHAGDQRGRRDGGADGRGDAAGRRRRRLLADDPRVDRRSCRRPSRARAG